MVLLLALILSSCIPTNPPNQLPDPTHTLAISSPTNTPLPTSTKIIPTATATQRPAPEIKEYGDTMINFVATVDFGIENKVNVEIAPNVFIRRWTPAKLTSGEIVAIPTFVEKPKKGFLLILSVVASPLSPTYEPRINDDVIDQFVNAGLTTSQYGTGEQTLNFMTGNMSDEALPQGNPWTDVLEGDLANKMIMFAESGGTELDVLIKVKDIPYPIAITFRIDGVATSSTPPTP